MPSLDGGTGWIGTQPITAADLRGKVVLVDFWEYTCINCLRTLPYLSEWYKRYHNDGFEIIGVHTPEFPFSHERKNVEAAMKRLGVVWPVVLDDNDTIWKRFNNSAWPAEYLFDQNGHLVEAVSGEGGYQDTEARIQALLHRENPSLKLPPLMALLPQDNYTKPGAVCYPRTPEFLIYEHHIADPPTGRASSGNEQYHDSGPHVDGQVYLDGLWRREAAGIVSGGSEGYATIAYHAIEVVAVMRGACFTVRVDVTQDGKPVPREDAGSDIRYDGRGNSYIDVSQPRAYQVIMNAVYGHHQLLLAPEGDGLALYSFAFESCEVPGTSPASR